MMDSGLFNGFHFMTVMFGPKIIDFTSLILTNCFFSVSVLHVNIFQIFFNMSHREITRRTRAFLLHKRLLLGARTLLGTSASLLVTSALLVVTRSYVRGSWHRYDRSDRTLLGSGNRCLHLRPSSPCLPASERPLLGEAAIRLAVLLCDY